MNNLSRKVVILGGGTNTYISNHLALSAPAYGTTAITLEDKFRNHSESKMQVDLYLTKMADQGSRQKSIKESIKYRKESLLRERLSQTHVNVITRSILELEEKLLKYPVLDTPEDIETLVDQLIVDPDVRVIIFNVAMVDYKPLSLYTEKAVAEGYDQVLLTQDFGKYTQRLSTSKDPYINLELKPYDKIINKIRKERKDILLVGFKTTCGATKEEQFLKGLKLCKDASANIVFVNDVDEDRITTLKSKITEKEKLESILKYQHDISINLLKLEKEILDLQNNGLVTPEESSYWYNTRDEALDALVQMVLDRSHLHFTRSTVVDAETISWDSELIPETFKTIFDFVRGAGAYKLGPTKSTVGHFGLSLGPNEFLTSKRKTDFNKIEEVGLVRVITDDPDDVFGYKHFFRPHDNIVDDALDNCNQDELSLGQAYEEAKFKQDYAKSIVNQNKVIAFGAKPSVGGQSQRSLFDAYPNLDCILHFHCPLRFESRNLFKPVQQFGVECGSHECGQNTAMNIKEFKLPSGKSVWAVHLDHHGPNILFDSTTSDPQEIIEFIETHWALDKRTTGLSDELI